MSLSVAPVDGSYNDFLPVCHCNYCFILYQFWVIGRWI